MIWGEKQLNNVNLGLYKHRANATATASAEVRSEVGIHLFWMGTHLHSSWSTTNSE